MIHEACMPVYIVIQIFLAHGRDGRDQPKVVQEVLADLKSLFANFEFPGVRFVQQF